MSTKAPKSITLRTVPVSSMPGLRSAIESTSVRKMGLGSSSRGVAAGLLQLGGYVQQRGYAHTAQKRRLLCAHLVNPRFQIRQTAQADVLHRAAAQAQAAFPPRRNSRVNGGIIQHIAAFLHAQKTCPLFIGFGTEFGYIQNLPRAVNAPFSSRYATIFFAVAAFSPPAAQQGRAGRVQIHAHSVDAVLHHAVQRLVQLLFGQSCWYWPTPMAFGVDLTSSARGSWSRRAMDTAERRFTS